MEIPVVIEIPADVRDGTVRVEIAFAEPDTQSVLAAASVEVLAGVPPVGAHPDVPLPPAMLGGFNVAWSALGGVRDDPAQAALIDTVIDVGGVNLYGDAVIRLATGNPVPLSGVVLELPPAGMPSNRLAAFAIELSLDGTNFERVLDLIRKGRRARR